MVDLGIGELVMSVVDGSLWVDRADPRIWVAGEILHEIREGRHHPDVHFEDDLLRIEAVNERVVYRVFGVERADLPRDLWLAAWPD